MKDHLQHTHVAFFIYLKPFSRVAAARGELTAHGNNEIKHTDYGKRYLFICCFASQDPSFPRVCRVDPRGKRVIHYSSHKSRELTSRILNFCITNGINSVRPAAGSSLWHR